MNSPAISAGASSRSAAPRRSPRRCRWWRRRRCARRSRRRSTRARSRGCCTACSAARPHTRGRLHASAARGPRGPQACGHPGRAPTRACAAHSTPTCSGSPSQFDPASTVFITAGRKAAQFVARTRPAARRRVRLRRLADIRRGAGDRRASPATLPEGRGGPGADRRDAVRQHAHPGAGDDRVSAGRRDQGLQVAGAESRGELGRRHDRDRVRAERRGGARLSARRITSTSTSTTCC